MATQFARRSGIGFVGLRISNIMEPEDYAAFPSYWDDPAIRKWNLWGYVDARDVATAARLAAQASSECGAVRRAGASAGARGVSRWRGDLHRRRSRHGDDPRQRRPHGRGVPRRPPPSPAG